jgi:hypothetical protein
MKKLVAENLNEFDKLNESITNQYKILDKTKEGDVKEFAFKLALRKYTAGIPWEGDAVYKTIKTVVEKSDLNTLLFFLETAAKDNFNGRSILLYADPQAKTGRKLAWKPASEVNLSKEKTA